MTRHFQLASPWIALGILTSLVSACSSAPDQAPQASTDPAAPAVQETCPQFIASLPPTYAYDWLSVPEEPGNPASPEIKIFYYYPKDMAGEVTLFLNGGPGGSSHSSFKLVENSLNQFSLVGRISFVFMDQRGTGCSSDYPNEARDEDIYERARWYGTRGIAADAEAIREKLLGARPWSVLGQSYGAFIVHRYAIQYPASLHRALAYANTINADPHLREKNRIASQFFAWDKYFDQYPDDRNRIRLLLAGLTTTSCVTTPGAQQLCGYELISPLVAQYLGFMDSWPRIHKILVAVIPQDTVQWGRLKRFAIASYSFRKHWQNLSLYTVDVYDRNTAPMDAEECSQIASELKTETPAGPEFNSYLTECSVDIQFVTQASSFKRVKTYFGDRNDHLTIQALKDALEGAARGKFYLYSAEVDPYVPARSFGEELAEVKDLVKYRNFLSTGHEGFYTQNQVLLDLVTGGTGTATSDWQTAGAPPEM